MIFAKKCFPQEKHIGNTMFVAKKKIGFPKDILKKPYGLLPPTCQELKSDWFKLAVKHHRKTPKKDSKLLNKLFEVDEEVNRLKINPQSYDRSGTLESAPEIELVYAGN